MTRPHFRCFSLLLMSVLLSACGGGGGGGTSTPAAPVATLSPSSLDFGVQSPGVPSSARAITLRNSGNASLALSSPAITLSGTNAADFSQSSGCGSNLAAGASCTIDVTFTASSNGAKTAMLNVASNAAGSPATAALTGAGGDNAVALSIDMGPLPTTNPTANVLYTSVVFCTPGSVTDCRTVDHIQVDTGSFGLRVFKSALEGTLPVAPATPVVVPTPVNAASTANALFECVQYADGYTWGAVVLVDATIGTRKLSNLAIQLTGATNYFGAVPAGCASANPNNENSVPLFGANGILGVGGFIEDCGSGCAPTTPATSAPEGHYYQCPAGAACTATQVTLASQIQNPVHLLSQDNNGILIKLPALTAPGAVTHDGVMLFGVNTQANNSLGSAAWYQLDPGYGTLTTVFGGTTLTYSIVDSGSNAYFFDSSLTVCSAGSFAPGFYCPAASTAETATIRGFNNASTSVSFTVDNADTLFQNHSTYAAFPNLGASTGGLSLLFGTFDWGLPFYLGRPVFVLFEGNPGPTGSGVTGPALAF